MNITFTDPRDRILMIASPVVPQPRFSALPGLEPGQHRYLLAEDGVFLEARSRVLHACVRVGDAPGLPFGHVESFLRVVDGDVVSPSLMDDARELARQALPNEWAGVLVRRGGKVVLHLPEVIRAERAAVTYSTAGFEPMDLLLDLHSHANFPAFFSAEDDRDDRSNPSPVFVSGVFGSLGLGQEATMVLRLMVLGRPYSMDLSPIRASGLPEPQWGNQEE